MLREMGSAGELFIGVCAKIFSTWDAASLLPNTILMTGHFDVACLSTISLPIQTHTFFGTNAKLLSKEAPAFELARRNFLPKVGGYSSSQLLALLYLFNAKKVCFLLKIQ